MIEDRTLMLVDTIRKLYKRGALHNITRIIEKTHKADIAAAFDHFSLEEISQLLVLEKSLEDRAKIFSYLEADHQKELIPLLPAKEVHQIVSLMDSDDAADLLGELSAEETKEILSRMEKDDSDEVADLMGYPEDSAGGLMSSDYLALDENQTVSEAIKIIQEEEESLILFYIYVVNEHNHLLGVVSLKQLLLAKKDDRLKDFMTTEVISTTLITDQEDVAKEVERYDFLCIPVVDDKNRLMGVITVDDILDVIREEAEEELLALGQAGSGDDESIKGHIKGRIPWLCLAYLAGALCFVLVYFFGGRIDEGSEQNPLWVFAAYIPLLLSLGGMLGSQSATVAINELRNKKGKSGLFKSQLFQEIVLGLFFATFFSIIIVCSGLPFLNNNLVYTLAAGMFVQIFASALLGVLIPFILDKTELNTTSISVPLFTAFANLLAISLLILCMHISRAWIM